jgi:hypothetical protein
MLFSESNGGLASGPRFQSFTQLNPDLQVLILSYVSTAPCESLLPKVQVPKEQKRQPLRFFSRSRGPSSGKDRAVDPEATGGPTLTSILPLVCKAWYSYSKLSDELWRDALVRQLTSEPTIWGYPVQHRYPQLLVACTGGKPPSANAEDTSMSVVANLPPAPTSSSLGDQDGDIPQEEVESSTGFDTGSFCRGYQWYRFLYQNHAHLRPAKPVFIMPMSTTGSDPESYGLHLFEPRYLLMIQTLLHEHEQRQEQRRQRLHRMEGEEGSDAANGDDDDAIYFLHAHRGLQQHLYCEGHNHLSHRGRRDYAKPRVEMLLVRLLHCQRTPHNTIAVQLQVAGLVELSRWWTRPNTGGLAYATGRIIKRYRAS